MARNEEATLLLKIKAMGEDVLDRVSAGLEQVGKIGAAAFAALAGLAAKAVHDFREQELATNQLTQAMINNGMFTAKLRDEYVDMASALQKVTTYGDEQIIAAQAVAQQNLGNIKITESLTRAILDFATAQKMDLESAASVVTKSIGGSTNALARYGVELDTGGTKSQRMQQAIDGLNKKFKGQAEAAAEGLGGIAQLKNAVSDLSEELGERLKPIVVIITSALKGLATDSATTGSFMTGLVEVFKFLAKGAVYVGEGFVGLGQIIGTVLGSVVETTKALIKGQFAQAKEIMASEMETYGQIAEQRAKSIDDKLAVIDQAFQSKKAENRAKDLADEEASAQNVAAVKQQAADDEFIRLETRRQEMQALRDEEALAELTQIGTQGEAVTQAKMAILDKQIANETNAHTKAGLLRERAAQQDLLLTQNTNKAKEQMQRDTFATIATLSSSNNQTLASIGKAAGITQIAIDTPVAVSKALAAFPPPFNFIAAGLVGAAMAAQAAKIAGVPLAEGGVVQARPGGIQATIGEGGKDEAVIPLDEYGNIGGGSNITINVYGGMLGDQATAHQFAIAVDRKLLELRKNNESVAFDAGVV